jgi:hypothetical protein
LQGSHHLDGPLGYYQGGVAVPEADYVAVGELLAVDLGRDYTFLHPEVLEDRCTLDGNQLVLPNQIHPGRFRVLVLPGHKTIRWSSLQKIQAFYDQGGCVIATGQLPFKSADFGHDDDVARTIAALFGAAVPGADKGESAVIRRNRQGGCAIHLATLTAQTLREALDATKAAPDVAFEPGQALRYIHKCWKGRHIYFFANLNSKLTESAVTLRGRHDLEAWDPHTGKIRPIQATYGSGSGTDFTRIQLPLPYLKFLFLVSHAMTTPKS